MSSSSPTTPKPFSQKAAQELAYWQKRRESSGGVLKNGHFERFFTSYFELSPEFYSGKRMLDIGCGPRGSLEWAAQAALRVGLDPLADAYRELGTDKHQMRYVAACSESIPFADGYFDVVSTFNSLDHVDQLEQTVSEILRVLAPAGRLLLITDVNHAPTVCEPNTYSWDILERFSPPLDLLRERRYERNESGIYASLLAGKRFDERKTEYRSGVLTALFAKES